MIFDSKIFVAAGVVALSVAAADASTIRTGFAANTLAANDDGSTGQVATGFAMDFFGVTANNVYVNNNGNITLDSTLSTYTPFDLTSTGQQIIAPFFADVDTSAAGDPVTYGQGTVNGHNAFGVNWLNVDYYSSDPAHTNRNSFQLVLIERSDTGAGNFDIEFNYGQIEWDSGEASNGDQNGLNGDSARAGFSNGTGVAGTFFELAGSATNDAFLDGGANSLVAGSNIGVAGRFLFTARNGTVVNPPNPSAVPLPAGFPLLFGALAIVGATSRRKKRNS